MLKSKIVGNVLLGLMVIMGLVSCSDGKSSSIENASNEQIEVITEAIELGSTVSNFKTVKSKDFANVYFVSAIITDLAGNKTTGIWATGGKTNISMVMSANIKANEVSPWPYGPNSQARISYKDDGGELLLQSYK